MDAFQAKTNGALASATLVNAKTGEILATSQRPTFNADTLEGITKDYNWKSALYQTNFEPGSTLKVMTLASAIDDGVFKPNDVFSNANGITIADATIQDWSINEGVSTGRYMTYAQGFAYSSNVGMTKLEQKMGNDKWLNYLAKFKFGYPTRFGLGSEESGIFPSNNIVTQAMSAFGQGISVTQIQMLRAFLSISNNGVMVQPQFVSQIYDPNSSTYRTAKKEVVGKPVTKKAASETRDYMVNVGTDPVFGTLYAPSTGPIIKVGNLPVAVKSGTAQIAAEDGSGYLDSGNGNNNNLLSVVAMVPSDNPDFVMYVTVQQPEHWSGLYWAEVINPVLEEAYLMQETLQKPVQEGKETAYELPDLHEKNPGTTADELRRNLIHPVILGNGDKIIKVSKDKGSKLKANQQVLVLTNDFTTMPDMYGWTESNVKKFAKWTGIEVQYKGSSGKVTKQSADVGKPLKKIKKLKITLGD